MSAPNSSKLMALAAVGAVIALAAASCVIPLRGRDDLAASGKERSPSTDPMALDLMRCRTVKSQQASDYGRCHRSWTDRRRRFLNMRSAASAGTDPANLQQKDQAP